MAFGVTVHRRADDEFFNSPPKVSSEEYDVWQVECERRWLYESPIGSDGTFFEWWHVPAHRLGLRLIAGVYHNGLEASGSCLDELGKELDLLEAFWDRSDFSRSEPVKYSVLESNGREQVDLVPLLQHLQEGLRCMRKAISIAGRYDGIVVLS